MDCRGNLGSVWDITGSLITTAAAIFPAKYKKNKLLLYSMLFKVAIHVRKMFTYRHRR